MLKTALVAATQPANAEKPHFPVLDGLRGIAAICVVIFHFSEMVVWDYSKLWIGHGWLAVDFFFCLSGFVIGYAYDDRMATMGLRRFFKARLFRLHPMVVFGSVLGLIALYVNPFEPVSGLNPGKMALIFVASVTMIPYGALHDHGRSIFGLNAPAWSLFWEYMANIAFAVVMFRLRRGALVAFTLASAALLCWASHRAGNLYGGWSLPSFWDGGIRVAFSFSAGLLVYRLGWRPSHRLGFLGLSLLLVLALAYPYAQGAWIREVLIVVLYFPLLVALAAGAKVSAATEKLCRISGDLSYPLYMTHYAVIWIWGDFAEKHPFQLRSLWLTIAVGTATMIGFAWIVSEFFDKPVRSYLRKRF